jgi:hypothetical protein
MKYKVYLFAIGCALTLSTKSYSESPQPERISVYPQPAVNLAADGGKCCDASGKICVTESKPTTRTVYGSMCKEHCQPRSSLFGWMKELCDDNCANGNCGDVRTVRVLIKKTVPGPTVHACVLKEAAPCKPLSADAPKTLPLIHEKR